MSNYRSRVAGLATAGVLAAGAIVSAPILAHSAKANGVEGAPVTVTTAAHYPVDRPIRVVKVQKLAKRTVTHRYPLDRPVKAVPVTPVERAANGV